MLAKKAKLDLASIPGTGEFGRVTADDVKIATGEMKPKRAKAAPGAPAPVEMPEGLVPFTGMQRAVSNNMVATLDCPVFRASREIEMDAFNALYQSVKPKGVTVSALLAKAVAKAIEKHPIVNSSFREEGTFFNKDINIAMAVAIDGGLITPVLKYANERDVLDIGENWKVSCLYVMPGYGVFELKCRIFFRSWLERPNLERYPLTSTTRERSPFLIWECLEFRNSTPSSPLDRAASLLLLEPKNTLFRTNRLFSG